MKVGEIRRMRLTPLSRDAQVLSAAELLDPAGTGCHWEMYDGQIHGKPATALAVVEVLRGDYRVARIGTVLVCDSHLRMGHSSLISFKVELGGRTTVS